MSRRTAVILLLSFYAFTIFLTLNRHSKSGVFNYHSEIWADAAGYYVYLPLAFIYNFDADKLPHAIDVKTGFGFSISDKVVKTKYTYGVALLQSPFFFATHLLSNKLGFESNGFSSIYHKMINISAVTYSILGLILLYIFLIDYVSRAVALISIFCIYSGTNLFYYSVFHTGMSHVYSFFLFTCFLVMSKQIIKPNASAIYYALFGLTLGLIIVVRPINILLTPTFFLINNLRNIRIKEKIKGLLIIIATSMMIVIPQFLFWNYSEGKYFTYSYKNEGFTNLFSPKISELWFSTNNGLFIYSPLVLFMFSGLFFLKEFSFGRKMQFISYVIILSIVFASWHDWGYGCSYGSRPYVEYFSILALPFASFIEQVRIRNVLKYIFGSIIILLITYNQKLIFSYDGCWYGGVWDWEELWRLFLSKTK
jgi:hypothetical protein